MEPSKEANSNIMEYSAPISTKHLSYDGLHHVQHSTLEHYEQLSPGKIPVTAEDKERPVSGLRRRTLFVLIGLLAVLVIVGGVAGGMGAALAHSNRKSADAAATASAMAASAAAQSASSTGTASLTPKSSAAPVTVSVSTISASTSTTTTAAPTTSASGTIIKSSTLTLVRDCPSTNGTITTIAVSPAQRFLKYCNFVFSASHSNAFNVVTTTFDACIALCGNYNMLVTSDSTKCNGVSWRYSPSADNFGVCFGLAGLVNMVGRIADGSTADAPVDGAFLLS